MKLLLDTHCWLWWFGQPERLKSTVVEQILDEANEVWVSAASIWEMGIKAAARKLSFPEPLESYFPSRMEEIGARPLDITAAHALQASALSLHHKDPFDRMLIAQAQTESMVIVTSDSMFDRYDVSILKATRS